MVTERLPEEFLAALRAMPHGIGGLLHRLKLESWRELLWFRLGTPPHWATAVMPSSSALIRLYRIITGGQPALVICESFAVEMHSGLYRLAGSPESIANTENGIASSAAAKRRS